MVEPGITLGEGMGEPGGGDGVTWGGDKGNLGGGDGVTWGRG